MHTSILTHYPSMCFGHYCLFGRQKFFNYRLNEVLSHNYPTFKVYYNLLLGHSTEYVSCLMARK